MVFAGEDAIPVRDTLFAYAEASGINAADSIPEQSIQDSLKVTPHQVKRWVAAVLAFPLIGITGAHRIYLGCAPYVPIVYLGTLGGFGILPTIDFFVIVFSRKEKFESYQNNPRVFMWAD